ncbi:coagulation factor X-activating enzyme heavy chain-like [Ptychodera flava]|uniref:coagulation factor X-activating enzyme heavy chain-like n=1 Tax=Ptychodera flava TaxID=63121 RepID=UPI003969D36F
MTRNRELIRPKAELLRRQGTQNVTERLPFDSHKHFIGHVIKRDLSTGAELARGIAAFTQTKGLDGSLYIDGKEIKLTPFKAESSVHDLHIIYMAEEERGDLTNDMIRIEAIDTSAFSSRKKRDLAIAEQTVELMVTVEHDVYEELGYGAVDYMLSCVNFAQAIFMDDSLLAHGIKIKFTVVKMVLLESDELLSLTGQRSYGDITDLFATFAFSFERQQTWRDGGEEDLKYYDVAVVVGGTSVFDNGNDVGLSSFQGCDVNNHYIAIKYYTNDHTARILARQLGHVVGMDNDEPTQECYEVGIMSDVNVLTFTSCNRYDAMAYLSSQEGACFSDVPDDTVIFEALRPKTSVSTTTAT